MWTCFIFLGWFYILIIFSVVKIVKNPTIFHATKRTLLSLSVFSVVLTSCRNVQFFHVPQSKLLVSHSPSLLCKEEIKVSSVVGIVISLPGGRDWTHTAWFCALCPEWLTGATSEIAVCVLTHSLFLIITKRETEKCKHRCGQHVACIQLRPLTQAHCPLVLFRRKGHLILIYKFNNQVYACTFTYRSDGNCIFGDWKMLNCCVCISWSRIHWR